MTTVHMWIRSRRSVVGHASMQCGSLYVTWWPTLSLLSPTDLPRPGSRVQPVPTRVFEDDRRDEGRDPDLSLVIAGMDERRVAGWWRGLTGSRAGTARWDDAVRPWTEFGWNSVRLVATALEKGRPDANDFWMSLKRLTEGNKPVWTAAELRNCLARPFVSPWSDMID